MNLTKSEQETIIRGSAADQVWDIVTADSRVKTRLKRRGWTGQPDHQLSAPFEKFTIPFDRLKFMRAEKRKSTNNYFQRRSRAAQTESKPESHTSVSPGENNG